MKKVLFSEQKIGEFGLGIIELNHAPALNALDTEMLESIEKKARTWEASPEIAIVIFISENPKAFCAGGDVKSLAIKSAEIGLQVAKDFFTQEYFTDAIFYRYKKPTLSFLNGVTMGGGIGLTQGTSFRLVSESTVLAMPEVFISLFPDVGATHFLSRVDRGLGYYLGLTGERISGVGGVNLGWQNGTYLEKNKRRILADLTRLPWQGSFENDRNLLGDFVKKTALASPLQVTPQDQQVLAAYRKIENEFLQAVEENDFEKCIALTNQSLQDERSRSLLSQILFLEMAKKNRNVSIESALELEWVAAVRSCELPYFREGVRAVLIEKDHKPSWPDWTFASAAKEVAEILKPDLKNELSARFQARD